MTATEAKAKLLSLLDDVAAGEEIEVTKRGRIIARLGPATGAHALKGSLVGVAVTAGTDADLYMTTEDWDAS